MIPSIKDVMERAEKAEKKLELVLEILKSLKINTDYIARRLDTVERSLHILDNR